jgi:hypothetical protein
MSHDATSLQGKDCLCLYSLACHGEAVPLARLAKRVLGTDIVLRVAWIAQTRGS